MTRYRDHRGLFADSLKTIVEVNSKEDLAEHLGVSVYEISIQFYVYDDREGWDADTYIVTTSDGVCGFLDNNFKEKEEE